MQDQPAVAVLPYGAKLGFAPGKFPLDRMHFPLGQPKRLRGKRLADLTAHDHVILYPSDLVHYRPSFGTRAQVSLMVVEPEVIHGRHLRKLKGSHKKFFRVFSSNERFLAIIPNGILLVYGTTWVPDWQELTLEKTKNLSLIASSKRSQEGHVLRHEMVDWMREERIEFDALGAGYAPFERKSDGLAPYRYSIVIENTRERNYFSEKLIDAILCETVPIYWGCPNLADFMDTSGMIICESAADLHSAVQGATASQYENLASALRQQKAIAAQFGDIEARAAKALLA